jgi:hypothetical protein
MRTATAIQGVAAVVLLALLAAGGITASGVDAHVNGVANSSISTAAGPVGSGITYAGRFGNMADVDYYYFTTTRDNAQLHFTVRNTLASCRKGSNCQIYATLIDPAGKQLGGEGSAAGTGPVGYAGSGYSTDSIDWTFGPAGRYLLVFDSDGDLPSYEFDISPADGIAAGTPLAPPGPLFRALSVPSPQKGPRVAVAFTNLQAGATARVDLFRTVRRHAVAAGHTSRHGLAAGRISLRAMLNTAARAALANASTLRVTVRTTVSAPGRVTQIATRRVTVH